MWPCGSGPLIVLCQEEQGHQRSETTAECDRPHLGVGVGVRRVCWDPVPTEPWIPPGLSWLCPLPCQKQWWGPGRPLAVIPFPSPALPQPSEDPVGSISNYPHPTPPHTPDPFPLSCRCLLSAHSVSGTLPGVAGKGWIKLDPCPKEVTA